MGLLSSTVSLTSYKVNGKFERSVSDSVLKGLQAFCISDIDEEDTDKSVGWTSWETPYQPDFSGSSFMLGTYLIFSMRIDKKSLPPKIINKHYTLAMEKRLTEDGRAFLSKNEKKLLKESIVQTLNKRIPATPNIYDVVWNYEDSRLWFFSNLKAANEELESLFLKSFHLSLTRIFPYTGAYLLAGLSDIEKDTLAALTPTSFRK